MEKDFICIVCPKGCHIHVDENQNITGYTCKRGLNYVSQELVDPRRTLTSTFKVEGGVLDVCPCKSQDTLPKDKIFEAMKEINKVTLKAPIKMHDVVVKNILNTGIDIIATKGIDKI